MATRDEILLTLSCRNQPGIVASVSGYLFQAGCNILDAQQFDDTQADNFFMRVVFNPVAGDADLAELARGFQPIAGRLGMTWKLRRRSDLPRAMILVSRQDHCLVDLLYRHRTGELPMQVTAIVSNHPRDAHAGLDLGGIPYHHLPVTPETKLEQETALWNLVRETDTEVVVLARYMQVLSDALAAKLAGRCINIHHSFLPGFKGARPYHQAHQRGVKLIGATAHYVTSDLDEGPIIEQDVERISHRDSPEDLVRRGRDIERRVLAKALLHHLEQRVIIYGRKTVVFTG